MDDDRIFSPTLAQARNAYLSQASFKSVYTIRNYTRAIDLFLTFLEVLQDGELLPFQKRLYSRPTDTPLALLSPADAPMLFHFAVWMRNKKNFEDSTILLYLAGMQSWLKFCDYHGWLPDFPLARAREQVHDEMQKVRSQVSRRAPEPPDYIEHVVYYYDTVKSPDFKDEQAAQRWELTQLRNRALMRALAETGGRISEVLSLNLADFPPRCFEDGRVLRVKVEGKGKHKYDLRLLESLPAIRVYIEARGEDTTAVSQSKPLFVVHSPTLTRDGQRMTRHNATYVVCKASEDLGLKGITPHQFRHWRASQLVNAGVDLDIVQDYLGHQSIETTRRFYARTDARRIDEAARRVGLPSMSSPGF